jgi:glutamate carboxypeptidase
MSQAPIENNALGSGERALLAWLSEQQDAMVKLLAEVVGIDSGSYNKRGVDAVGARFARFFADHGIAVATIAGERSGNIIRAQIGATDAASVPILLMGHQDTVFPDGEASRRPFRIDNGRGYGPGVADMKAGLVMHAFVLAAFRHVGASNVPLVALFTSDEEIGSPFSRPFIEAEARKARVTLNAEPARPSGNVVTGRKGGVFMRCEVYGKAAHSGSSFADGASAISELAHKIIALDALTDLPKGITVNVGLVRGGQSINTTAPHAQGEIDLRFIDPRDRNAVMAEIEGIVGHSTIGGTRADLAIMGEFLPLVPNAASTRLLEQYQAAARDLGIAVEGEFTGACADSGFSAGVGTPTLCGMGPIGGKVHTPDEFLEIDSLVPRAQLAALTIARIAADSSSPHRAPIPRPAVADAMAK